MWLRARSKTALCLSVVSFLFTPAIAKHQETTAVRLPAHRVAVEHLTCDRSVIDPGETGVVKFLAERNPDFDPEWDDETDAGLQPPSVRPDCALRRAGRPHQAHVDR